MDGPALVEQQEQWTADRRFIFLFPSSRASRSYRAPREISRSPRLAHKAPVMQAIQDMAQSSVFYKLDLKWGYHQLELGEESRDITTFTTHAGLYRYKRLMFGVTSAPEIYQHAIQQALHGCEGVRNISDDIILHGKDDQQHDERLEKLLERLQQRGLTLNSAKCKFKMPQLEFMGYLLSTRGIGPC